ncbi:hypothetical protein BDQ12DRAFT_15631 [Crucibulum laeve]|uniref:Zn(2)-C6 fungal-type domain-containing protein n=1 Tax=Crucibulum laeve TaxID=68775 RepID=A0A5C3MG69_9AGAR|nr:hypothetical protein BDQ12DRAFT_15631 [Crucibulum laeve]
MADSISYSTNQYLPPHNQYYPPPSQINPAHGHVHVVAPPARTEPAQRKRPKYTRSKTGCMTCRVKKIKCDETKPNCMRCTHGQRDCTWPEGAPARKKPAARKDSMDGRPSTAGSSSISEASTPPTREPSPPSTRRELSLAPPSTDRRTNDSYLQLHPMPSEHSSARRQVAIAEPPTYTHHNSNSNVLSLMPESTSYSSRYDHGYSRHAAPYRSIGHSAMGSQWSQADSYVSLHPLLHLTP